MRLPHSLTRFLRGEPPPHSEPEPAAEAVVTPEPEPLPEQEPEPALALVPAPPPAPVPEPAAEPGPEPPSAVVPLAFRDRTPRTWNLWELERLAAALPGGDAASEERSLLLIHMRQFADTSGDLPVEFDSLVRDAFGSGLAGIAR